MADISQIKIGGTTYDIKDSTARNTIVNGIHFIGTTKLAITDLGTTSAFIVGTVVYYLGTLPSGASLTGLTGYDSSVTYTFKTITNGDIVISDTGDTGGTNGDIVISDTGDTGGTNGDIVISDTGDTGGTNAEAPKEFIAVVDGTSVTWEEFGSTGALKGLAFKDSLGVSVPTSGHTHTISKITHSVTKSDVTVSGDISIPALDVSVTNDEVLGSATTFTNGTSSVGSFTGGSSGKLTTTSVIGVGSTTTTASKATKGTTISGLSKITAFNGGSAATLSAHAPASKADSDIVLASVDGEVLSLNSLAFGGGAAASMTYTSNTSIDPYTFSDVTVPIKNASSTTVATGGISATNVTTNVGGTVVTASPTGATAAAQTITVGTNDKINTVKLADSSTTKLTTTAATSSSLSMTGSADITISDHTNVTTGAPSATTSI